MFIKSFQQINKNDVSLAGGKGASLGEMTQAGIPVPPGFVVLSSAFDNFLAETDINVEVEAILKKVRHNDIASVELASKKIRALIATADFPHELGLEVKKEFKKLKSKWVAVRSSATAEDSSTASWAGELESFLNTDEKSLLNNIKKCWSSLFTPRAIFYRFEKKLHRTKVSVAVVVQAMVDSEVSGIAFSVHPVTEDKNQLIIEASWGLGEAIVSGQVTPDAYVVLKKELEIFDINVNIQERAMVRAASGGNKWLKISPAKGSQQVLSGQEIIILAELIIKIEKHYKFPVDIEWARSKGKFYIVQSRPITTLS